MLSFRSLTVDSFSTQSSASEIITECSSDSSSSGSSSTETSSEDSDATEPWEPDPDSDFDYEDHPVDENDFASTADRINPLLRIRFDNRGKSDNTRPRLLFRAYAPAHGLRARRFLSHTIDSIPAPPRYESDDFGETCRRHLINDTAFASPFLSLTESPSRAINIILRSKEPLCLAVLDYNELEAKMRRRYGKGIGIYLVPQICRDHRLQQLWKMQDTDRQQSDQRGQTRGYTGTGEFLVWATVECDPVGIWNADEVRELNAAMRTVKEAGEISYDSGLSIAPHLDTVDEIYRQVVARKFLCAFKVPGCHKMKMDFDSFTRGLYREPRSVRSSVETESEYLYTTPRRRRSLTPQHLKDDDETIRNSSDEEDWVDVPSADIVGTGTLNNRQSRDQIDSKIQSAKKIRITVQVPTPPSTDRKRILYAGGRRVWNRRQSPDSPSPSPKPRSRPSGMAKAKAKTNAKRPLYHPRSRPIIDDESEADVQPTPADVEDEYDDDKTQWLVDAQLARMCAPHGIRVFPC